MTFSDTDLTLGFKLVSRDRSAPTLPKGLFGYATSLVETMLEAHDKDHESRLNHANVIEIDNGGIRATQFNISEAQKSMLFNNGYVAASKFITQTASLLSARSNTTLTVAVPSRDSIELDVPVDFDEKQFVRFSIATAVRIYVDGKYLLIKGNRINQFQPVGGVLKRYSGANRLMRDLGVLDDKMFPIDEQSVDDLRVMVPFLSISRFLEWYVSEQDRETSPWREFHEELLKSGILPREKFEYIDYERIRTHVEGIRFSSHFKCYEVLIQELFELIPTAEQINELRLNQKSSLTNVIWVENDIIAARGYDFRTKKDVARISETSQWLL